MFSLENVILDWVGRINYSVFGYNEEDGWSKLDQDVSLSFKSISEVALKLQENRISFISFADTGLNAEKLEQWQVEPDKGRFYYSLCDIKRSVVDEDDVNEYYFFKDVLSKTMKEGTEIEKKLLGNPKSSQLAYVIKEPFVYQIQCGGEEVKLCYDSERKLLKVVIPESWLDFKKNNLRKEIKEIKYHPVKYDNEHVVYQPDTDEVKDPSGFRSAYAVNKLLLEYIHTLSLDLERERVPIIDSSTNREGFARLILSLAYLAKIKNCCVESIPGVVADTKDGKRCLGVFIWGYEGEENPYTPYFKLLADKLCICFAAKYIEPLRYVERIRLASINSAVAEIMSRNMSHNLGSHYLYYTKNQLSSLADKVYNIGPEIRGVAKVLGYVQARMDYLATIVSGERYPYGGVFLKGQIFDELTIDDFSRRHYKKDEEYKRTTNYLLQNIILSENFTRKSVVEDKISNSSNKSKTIKRIVRLQVILPDGKVFKGVGDDERDQKLEFSKMSVALPGGVMSVHAFFNVVENLIRNSAKYKKEDLKEELVLTIKINKIEPNTNSNNNSYPIYEFVIYDNKENAMSLADIQGKKKMTLLESMNLKIKKLQVLNENNVLDKSDKGIKEMLFSILWMRSYTYYEKKRSLADILLDIDHFKGDEKLEKIKEYAFEFVAVDKNGTVPVKDLRGRTNLGIRFCLPEFRKMEIVETMPNLIDKRLNNFTDMICVREKPSAALKKHITRVCYDDSVVEDNPRNAVQALKSILRERFGDDFDKYKLWISGHCEEGFNDPRFEKNKYGIYFKTHFGNNWQKDKREMNKYFYCEAISGGNFTKTIESLFVSGLQTMNDEEKYEAYYFRLKVKEAALTRITLIDERFYKDMESEINKREILMHKNIRILNLKTTVPNKKGRFFEGNRFRDGKNATHFLSIHLGMIEKIVGDEAWSKAFGIEKEKDRAQALMKWLRKKFRTTGGGVFISVHSGRGNFSKDLETSLENYPFINVSALENVLSNSKYLLAQLFYNNVFNYDD